MPKTLKDDLATVDEAHVMVELNFKCEATREFVRIALANALLFDRKMLDYGPGNIAKFGVVGCVIRASDKFERIAHLYKANRKRAANEKLEDSYRDIANYMCIILMLESGKWPS